MEDDEAEQEDEVENEVEDTMGGDEDGDNYERYSNDDTYNFPFICWVLSLAQNLFSAV